MSGPEEIHHVVRTMRVLNDFHNEIWMDVNGLKIKAGDIQRMN